MEGISPWQAVAAEELSNDSLPQLLQKHIGTFTFTVLCSPSALYIKVQWPEGSTVFRAAYCPGGKLKVKRKLIKENGITISMESVMGTFKSRIQIEDNDYPVLKFATALVPETDIHIPFWPKDIIIPENKNQKKNRMGPYTLNR